MAWIMSILRDKVKRMNESEHSWFKQGIQIGRSVEYGIQDVSNSDLENNDTSLIYCGAIIENGAREGKAIGVLGILFDWEALAVPILNGVLPRINDQKIEGGAAFYVNSKNIIIATTDDEIFKVGAHVELPNKNLNLEPGEAASGVFELNDKKYIIGSSKTQGYREYEGLGWSAHVVRPIE